MHCWFKKEHGLQLHQKSKQDIIFVNGKSTNWQMVSYSYIFIYLHEKRLIQHKSVCREVFVVGVLCYAIAVSNSSYFVVIVVLLGYSNRWIKKKIKIRSTITGHMQT